MRRKLLILPLLIALMLACVIPAVASNDTNTTGVAVTEGAGAPGQEVRMQVSIRSTFADNIGLVFTYDSNVLTLSDKSAWLISEGTLLDVNTEKGTAIWGADAQDVAGDIFELVFTVKEDAELGTTTTVGCTVATLRNNVEDLKASATANVSIKNQDAEEYPYGDVTGDGTVDTLDAMEILKYYNGVTSVISDEDVFLQTVADVTCDGMVDTLDAMEILKYYNGVQSVLDSLK